MRALLLAGGPAAGLDPLTEDIPAAMVPVLDRPLLAHVADLLARHGISELVAVLGDHGEVVREHFGDELRYRGALDTVPDEPELVIAGTVLADLDMGALVDAHAGNDADVTICATPDGWAPVAMLDPAAAVAADGDIDPRTLADRLAGLGMKVAAFAVTGYLRDVVTLADLREGTFAAITGRLRLDVPGSELDEGLVVGEGSSLDGVALVEPPVWIGADVQIGLNARLVGPLVLGDGATVCDGAHLRDTIVLPGAMIPRETVLAGGIAGNASIAASLPPRGRA